MGIRGKLVASLSGILVALTLVLGTMFAVREHRSIVELKRDHLRHSAQLAAKLLQQTDKDVGQRVIDAWNDTAAAGPKLRLVWSGDHGANATQANPTALNSSKLMMTVSIPLENGSAAFPAQLIAAEPLPDARTFLLGVLAGHLALGALLSAAASLGVAFVCQRVVVGPVRWLVSAADGMAQGDDWEPIRPENRRKDEIGVLGDHLAELSRRLARVVRSSRHDSAHLVAVGVRREMEEPLRRLTLSVATLEAAGFRDPDVGREVEQIEGQLKTLQEISGRLANVDATPAG